MLFDKIKKINLTIINQQIKNKHRNRIRKYQKFISVVLQVTLSFNDMIQDFKESTVGQLITTLLDF